MNRHTLCKQDLDLCYRLGVNYSQVWPNSVLERGSSFHLESLDIIFGKGSIVYIDIVKGFLPYKLQDCHKCS